MRVRGTAVYHNVLDIPEGTSGKVSIKHRLRPAGTEIKTGTFRTAMYGQPSGAVVYDADTRWHVLEERGQGVWMTDDPIEQRQTDELVIGAKGRVLVGGLGLGYAVAALAGKSRVTEIVVVERSNDVIALVEPHLRSGRKRVTVVKADLFHYLKTLPRGAFDWGLFDIWQRDGEDTFHRVIVPLRKLAADRVGLLRCWNEDIMRGQLMYGLHGRVTWALLSEEARAKVGMPPAMAAAFNPANLATPKGDIYWDWACPFWAWVRDTGPTVEVAQAYACRYVATYGLTHLPVDTWLRADYTAR